MEACPSHRCTALPPGKAVGTPADPIPPQERRTAPDVPFTALCTVLPSPCIYTHDTIWDFTFFFFFFLKMVQLCL